jgi:hypothetical protein
MILTDGTHLVSDTSIVELHTFAIGMRLSPWWFQGAGHTIPHYDIRGKYAQKIVEHDDVEVVTTREIVKRAVRVY